MVSFPATRGPEPTSTETPEPVGNPVSATRSLSQSAFQEDSRDSVLNSIWDPLLSEEVATSHLSGPGGLGLHSVSYRFPRGAVTNYHTLGGFRPQKFIPSRSGGRKSKTKVSAGLVPSGDSGRSCSSPSSGSRWPQASLACGHITPVQPLSLHSLLLSPCTSYRDTCHWIQG